MLQLKGHARTAARFLEFDRIGAWRMPPSTASAEETEFLKFIKSFGRNFHYGASALLAVFLLPLLERYRLPTRYDWGVLVGTFCVFGFQALFLAVLLLVTTDLAGIHDIAGHLRRHQARILLGTACLIILLCLFKWTLAIVIATEMIFVAEIVTQSSWRQGLRMARSILLPALYLFAGLLLVASYNDIILSVRFFAADDQIFNKLDQWLLLGSSVSRLCHWAVAFFPSYFFHFLELIYYGLFPVVGMGLLISSFRDGVGRGMQFVGAILTAYYITLALFYLWPSQGPYYLCPTHFADFPRQLQTYALQKQSFEGASALWNHVRLSRISFAYYIAFPCMHIAQSLIVLWFLRRWKPILIALSIYNLLLAGAIVLLEWHYLVDIIAGVLVAGVAVIAGEGGFSSRGSAPRRETSALATAK